MAPGMGQVLADIVPEQVLVLESRIDAATWESSSGSEPVPEKYISSSWV
jgi:hypothetical protein